MNLNWLPTRDALISGLKSLPLTIVLTVLIWMYAESQFTATEEAAMGNAVVTLPVTLRVSGPPELLAHVRVEPRVPTVQITVAGSAAKIGTIRSALAANKETGVLASLDVAPGLKPEVEASGTIHYVLPEGVALREGPVMMEYLLREGRP